MTETEGEVKIGSTLAALVEAVLDLPSDEGLPQVPEYKDNRFRKGAPPWSRADVSRDPFYESAQYNLRHLAEGQGVSVWRLPFKDHDMTRLATFNSGDTADDITAAKRFMQYCVEHDKQLHQALTTGVHHQSMTEYADFITLALAYTYA